MSRREQVPNSSLSLCIFLRYGFKMRIAEAELIRTLAKVFSGIIKNFVIFA